MRVSHVHPSLPSASGPHFLQSIPEERLLVTGETLGSPDRPPTLTGAQWWCTHTAAFTTHNITILITFSVSHSSLSFSLFLSLHFSFYLSQALDLSLLFFSHCLSESLIPRISSLPLSPSLTILPSSDLPLVPCHATPS